MRTAWANEDTQDWAKEPLIQFVNAKTLQVRLSEEALQREWLLASRVQKISQQEFKAVRLSPGQRLYNPLHLRFEVVGRELLVWRGIDPFFSKRLADKPWLRLPISSKAGGFYQLDFTPLLLVLYEGLDPLAGRLSPESVGAQPQLRSHYAHREGLEVDLYQKFRGLDTQLRHSLYLLPKEEMKARRYDARVGYYMTFTHQDKRRQRSINRYRITAGRKVHYWIDSRFPKLWQEGIIAGIQDWNKAFRALGLGDVLTASPYPEEGAFDPDAMTVNTIRYIDSDFANAQGKFCFDPRSGEIVQSDVMIYSAVNNLLHKWYYLQTAAYNPTARSSTLPDSVVHRLIRYVAAHEIGHCLGLEHNYRASASYPTDSLRSPYFTERYGTTPSIMDYARLNYIAQPNDGVTQVFPPLIGVYDIYAIAYGYGLYAGQEEEALRHLVEEAQHNPYLRYEKMMRGPEQSDPLVQANSLGDDGLKSANYALQNLRYILAHRSHWEQSSVGISDIAEAYYLQLLLLKPYLGGTYRHTLGADGRRAELTPVREFYQQDIRVFLKQEIERASTLFPKEALNTKTKRLLKELAL